MQMLIKTLVAFSVFLEALEFRLRAVAIERLERHKDKVAQERDKALQARKAAWESECQRHADTLHRIQQRAAEAELECNSRIAEDNRKIKQIDLA